MGASQSIDNRYTVEVQNSAKPGSTPIYRHPLSASGLLNYPESGSKTLYEVFQHACEHYATCMCVGSRQVKASGKRGEYIWKVYIEVKEFSRKIGLGFHRLGLTRRDEEGHSFVGIFSKNCEEWLISDLALMSQSITSVPIYDTQQIDTINMIVEQTQMRAVLTNKSLYEKICNAKSSGLLKTLEYLILFDEKDAEISAKVEQAGLILHTLKEVSHLETKLGKDRPPKPDSWFTICYTSGTTGKAKGAVITHQNMVATVAGALAAGLNFTYQDVYLSYLPLAHMFDRICIYTCLYAGSAIGFYSGDIMKIKEDLAHLKPTLFISVPRLYCRFYEAIQQTFSTATGAKALLVRKAVQSKLEAYKKNGALKSSFWDSIVFNKVQAVFGGRVRLMVTGSAPISADVLDFLKVAFSCDILEGYGQTETCAGSVITRKGENVSGILGGPTPSIEVKLCDVPDMNYFSTDKDPQGLSEPRGEICFRGLPVFPGYYKLDKETKEAIDEEGWLHSGDIGVISPYRGALKIIDRKKNFFKLSQGEYVSAEKIEIAYAKSRFISQIFVYGDSFQNYLIAVVVPNEDYIRKHWADHQSTQKEFKELCGDLKLKESILNDMGKYAKEEKLMGFEVVKKIHLEHVLWTTDDLLTPTQKLMRYQAKNRYEDVIKQLYAEN